MLLNQEYLVWSCVCVSVSQDMKKMERHKNPNKSSHQWIYASFKSITRPSWNDKVKKQVICKTFICVDGFSLKIIGHSSLAMVHKFLVINIYVHLSTELFHQSMKITQTQFSRIEEFKMRSYWRWHEMNSMSTLTYTKQQWNNLAHFQANIFQYLFYALLLCFAGSFFSHFSLRCEIFSHIESMRREYIPYQNVLFLKSEKKQPTKPFKWLEYISCISYFSEDDIFNHVS